GAARVRRRALLLAASAENPTSCPHRGNDFLYTPFWQVQHSRAPALSRHSPQHSMQHSPLRGIPYGEPPFGGKPSTARTWTASTAGHSLREAADAARQTCADALAERREERCTHTRLAVRDADAHARLQLACLASAALAARSSSLRRSSSASNRWPPGARRGSAMEALLAIWYPPERAGPEDFDAAPLPIPGNHRSRGFSPRPARPGRWALEEASRVHARAQRRGSARRSGQRCRRHALRAGVVRGQASARRDRRPVPGGRPRWRRGPREAEDRRDRPPQVSGGASLRP